MTKIILIRHGQSEGNLKEEFHGQYNSDLTEKGHAQAECTAEFLDLYKIDRIYASDIRRAFNTAVHTAKRRGLDVTKVPGMREICAGKWEQMKFTDIAEKYPKEYNIWYSDIANAELPDGETVVQMAHRVKEAFDKISVENDGKTVLIATHATPIRALFCFFDGLPLSEMQNIKWVPNASVSVVECDNCGGYRVISKGECQHLIDAGLLTALPKDI